MRSYRIRAAEAVITRNVSLCEETRLLRLRQRHFIPQHEHHRRHAWPVVWAILHAQQPHMDRTQHLSQVERLIQTRIN